MDREELTVIPIPEAQYDDAHSVLLCEATMLGECQCCCRECMNNWSICICKWCACVSGVRS
jgi:hypothetical protein